MNTNNRAYIHMPTRLGERVADAVAQGMGSWRFIIIQTVIVILWMIVNVIGIVHHWDEYPFILLNLVFSTQAAYASPLILMAGNRSAQKDRSRDDHEAQEVEAMFTLHQQILEQQTMILQYMKEQHVRDSSS